MADCASKLVAWRELKLKPSDDDVAQFSLLWRTEIALGDAEIAVRAVAGPEAKLTPAFPDEQTSRFWILTIPDLSVRGAERLAFETARCLREELDLQSARPVLVDSLIGAATVAPPGAAAEAILGKLCNSDDPGPEAPGWAPVALNVLEAWKKEPTRGKGVTIASIDTGYSDHAQLRDVIDTTKEQRNLVEGGNDAEDKFSKNVMLANPGHGTLVMSVVASRGDINTDGSINGAKEVTGTAPGASILPIRAIRSVVDVRQSRIPAAIDHAIKQKCDVIAMALGSAFMIEPVEEALRRAAEAGIVTICAAGNCFGPVVFPAKASVLGLTTAVAAVDYALQPWEKTSKGPEVTISAFGEDVWGARKKDLADKANDIGPTQGTTLATSLTAGVAALWVAYHGRDNLRAIAKRRTTTVQRMFNEAIQGSAYRPSGWPKNMGAGLVDAAALLAYSLDRPPIAGDAAGAHARITPLKRFAVSTVSEANSIAGQESAQLAEDFAAETLWRFYTANARARAIASGFKPPPGDAGVQRRSEALAKQLDASTELKNLI